MKELDFNKRKLNKRISAIKIRSDISVKKIKGDTPKYCTHCDDPASYAIYACNPKVVQQSITAVFCKKCMKELKDKIDKIVY
jgi:hypothetical protein